MRYRIGFRSAAVVFIHESSRRTDAGIVCGMKAVCRNSCTRRREAVIVRTWSDRLQSPVNDVLQDESIMTEKESCRDLPSSVSVEEAAKVHKCMKGTLLFSLCCSRITSV